MAIVYLHRRTDNNEIFYVGIGDDIKRAYDVIFIGIPNGTSHER